MIDRLKPRQTLFTHLSHGFDHESRRDARLPAGVGLAYDGLRVEF